MANGAAIHRTGEHNGLPTQGSGKAFFLQLSTGLWLGLGALAIVFIALTAALVWHSDQRTETFQHTSFTALSLLNVYSDLEEAEAREREYLLTGEPSYLGLYSSSRQALDDEFERLRDLVKNNPQELDETKKLRHLVYQKLDELQETIDTRDSRATAGFEVARKALLSHRGQQLMDAVRQDINRTEAEEQSTLSGFSREWRWRHRTGLAALAASALLALCCLGMGRIALARSASKLLRAEGELQASASRFGTLCDQAPVGIYETDAEGCCIYTNRRWSAMSGLSGSESLGHGWTKALHPDDRATVFEGWETAAKQGTAWEYRLLTGEEEIRWIRATGGPIYSERGELTGYVGTLEDVTERRQSEERFRLVVETAPSGMVIVDQEGKIVLVNSRTEELFGYRRRELLRQPVETLVPQASRASHAILQREFRANPQPRQMGAGRELHGQRKDGTQFPVEIGLNPIDTGSGNWVLASIVDITERRRAESALRESRHELRALAGRLFLAQEEERKRIARDLHDDLCQTVALLAFDISSLALVSPVEMKKSLWNLQTRIVELSADIRQIAHDLHPSILEDLGLTAALRELCEEFSARGTIQAVFDQKEMPEAPPVDIASCLYRVAQEALHNVQKHGQGARQVRLSLSGSLESVRLCIQDDGIGFDSEARSSGHGLGIISMKERVRLVQGEFSIHSRPGQGTTVTVLVPLSRKQSETPASAISG